MVTGAHGASTLCVQLRVGLLESKHALEGVLIPQQVMAANSAPEMHKRKQYAGELPAQVGIFYLFTSLREEILSKSKFKFANLGP